jgi:hypothetical protein
MRGITCYLRGDPCPCDVDSCSDSTLTRCECYESGETSDSTVEPMCYYADAEDSFK